MEQIILVLAVLAALSGFGMGLMNLAGPYLRRRKITLPAIRLPRFNLNLPALPRRGSDAEEDDDLDFEDEDDISAARDFAENSFAAGSSLLADRRAVLEDDEEELDEELASVLDQVAEEELTFEDEAETEEEGPVFYTVSAETHDGDDEPSNDGLDAFDEAEGEDEYEEDEEQEATAPEIHVIAAGGDSGNDMLSFFGESADDVAKAVQPWREDLPMVTIEELLTDARAIRQQINGNKPNAA